jgi:thiol-disulfide isomerase/thioredoxin
MRCSIFVVGLFVIAGTLGAQERAIVAQPKADPAAKQFEAVMAQALGALAAAGSYDVRVESTWGSPSDPAAPAGGGRYRLVSQGGKYRVEMQAQGAAASSLVCVNDGTDVTTHFPAGKLYSKHPAGSPQASLESNKMLALSLQGSALDILLQSDVARFVQGQAGGVKDHGEALFDGKRTRRFEVVWAGAQTDLWFAAEGVPLLLQFVRKTTVPTGMNQHYEMTCTAKFQWQLSVRPEPATFVLHVPAGTKQVAEIYDALSGDDAATLIGKPLPRIHLAGLDGADVELTAAPERKATVLIFWATWCAASVEDLPAVHQFVEAYKQKGVTFYAVNVGEQPGAVRRFTAQHPLVSTVLLDPHAKTTSALRLCELPAIAIVAPDNTVRAILHGSSKSLQGELAEQLDGLLKTAGNTAARQTSDRSRAK